MPETETRLAELADAGIEGVHVDLDSGIYWIDDESTGKLLIMFGEYHSEDVPPGSWAAGYDPSGVARNMTFSRGPRAKVLADVIEWARR